jgi:hypothetical protein
MAQFTESYMPGGRQIDHDVMAVLLHQHRFSPLPWRDKSIT